MRRRLLLRGIFPLLILTLLIPGTSFAQQVQTPAEPTPKYGQQQAGNPMIFGIASHAWWLDPEVYGDTFFPIMEELGVTTVRISIDWRRFEPEMGVWDWAMYDRVLGELARRNIEIVADFNTIPGWASVDKPGCDDSATEIYRCQLREDRYAHFENAIWEAVGRYSWITHWEFWNEPEMWTHLGSDGAVYIRHLRTFYDIAHAINPEVVVAAQTLVGAEYLGWLYDIADAWYGVGNYPWDAASIHPYVWDYTPEKYGRPLELNYDRLAQIRELMIEKGDEHKPVWITEYGWNNGVENQARNLVKALDWMKQQPWIEFAHLHMLHDWNDIPLDIFGLLGITPDENGNTWLDPDTTFYKRQPFYDAFKNYPKHELPALPRLEPDQRFFPETGHVVSGRFLKAWNERGGLRILGLPLTRPYPREQADGTFLLVQDFERARLEFHQQHIGNWAEVLGTLVGNDRTSHRRDEAPFVKLHDCRPNPDRDCYRETQHSLSYGMRTFWNAYGGLPTFGFPISEEFREFNPDTRRMHTVQYFERARAEYHPEFAGTEWEFLLGLLIRDDLQAQGWLPATSDYRIPTSRSYANP